MKNVTSCAGFDRMLVGRLREMRVWFLTGVVGHGKTTLARFLQDKVAGTLVVYSGTILAQKSCEESPLGRRVAAFFGRQIMPAQLVFDVLNDHLRGVNLSAFETVIFEGLPRSLDQLSGLHDLIVGTKGSVRRPCILQIDLAPFCTILRRSQGRMVCEKCRSIFLQNRCTVCGCTERIPRDPEMCGTKVSRLFSRYREEGSFLMNELKIFEVMLGRFIHLDYRLSVDQWVKKVDSLDPR